MAVGARITSTNLSGKTATVTFVPYTGSTSGSTQNLGSQTIPFNNITSHPYGVYSLYFAEYDYTYTLTVPEPGFKETFVFVDRMVGSDNYGVAHLNFTDVTAEVVDLGVDALYWDNWDIYPLQDLGYMHIFAGDVNSNEKLILFTDVNLTEVGRYSGTTNSYSYDTLMGKWVTFEDVDNGILKYFDGVNLYEYTWNPSVYYIDIENDWDSTTSDGTFIINQHEIGQWNYNGAGQSYIVNPLDGTTSLFKTWTDGTTVNQAISPSADFIIVDTRDNTQQYSPYTLVEIYNISGTLLETISLTGTTVNNRNRNFIGTNIYCTVYWDDQDQNVDFKVIHYNGNTETVTQTTHIRGTNYSSVDVMGDDNFYPENSNTNGGVVLSFYTNNNWVNMGMTVDYCDFVYMLPTQTSFNTYQFANGTTLNIQSYGQLSDFYRTYCSTEDGFFGALTISLSGATVTATDIPVSGVTSVNQYWLIDRTLYTVLTDSGINAHSILVNESGQIEQTINRELASAYSWNGYTQGHVGYVGMQTVTGNTGFCVYSGVTGFTEIEYYNNINTSTIFKNDTTYLRPSNMVLWNSNSLGFRILTSSGLSDLLSFPEEWSTNGNYPDLSVGENKFMLVYTDNNLGYTKIKLYDISGQLLNSYTTEYTNGWNNTWGIKNRFVVQCYNGDTNTNEYFLVSESNATSVTLQDYDNERTPNDWFWWWD